MITNIQKVFERVDHVLRGLTEFQTAITNEIAQCGATVKPEPGKDRSVARFILHINKRPNTDRLGLEFGELVHHLRAVLDNLVVTMAMHAVPNMPAGDLKKLSFVIAATPSEWSKLENKVRSLPLSYFNEMKRVQPFNSFATSVDGSHNLLVLLRDLDNMDKHYVQIVPSINQLAAGVNLSLDFEDEAAAERAGPPKTVIRDVRFEDNVNLFDIEVNEQIKDIKGTYNVQAELIAECNGLKFNTVAVLLQLAFTVQVIIDSFQVIDDPNCASFRVLRKA